MISVRKSSIFFSFFFFFFFFFLLLFPQNKKTERLTETLEKHRELQDKVNSPGARSKFSKMDQKEDKIFKTTMLVGTLTALILTAMIIGGKL